MTRYTGLRNIKISKLAAIAAIALAGCSSSVNGETTGNAPTESQSGTLNLIANGEDFVREGMVTKDGWQLDFRDVLVNVADVTAYQTATGFEPERDSLEPDTTVELVETATVVDLTEENTLATTEVPAGFYNALSWSMVEQDTADFASQTIVLDGTAQKDGQKIDFQLGFAVPVSYICGEYVGDSRKGMVKGEPAEVEMTFHFDHLFGDGTQPATEEINQKALGFEPIATLATAEKVTADWDTLQSQLTPAQQKQLDKAVLGLAHVGEGHCKAQLK